MRTEWKRAAASKRTYAMIQTDRLQAVLERELSDLYSEAWKELKGKVDSYFQSFDKRDAEMLGKVVAGEISNAEYARWRLTQIGRGDRWKTVRDDMAQRLANVSEQASAYINNNSASIYALHRNFTAYEIEGSTGANFALLNERTVRELVMGGNHVSFRTVNPNPVRNYRWNQQLIQRQLTASILQGEGIDGMAKRFLNVMGRNETAAIRNARTAMTSAQNAGKQQAFEDAEDMGITLMKEWVSTKDERTRDSHADIDGERVGVDEEFSNGLMYPADPSGDPAEVYNCRCTMRTIIEGYANAEPRETYREWEERKLSMVEYEE